MKSKYRKSIMQSKRARAAAVAAVVVAPTALSGNAFAFSNLPSAPVSFGPKTWAQNEQTNPRYDAYVGWQTVDASACTINTDAEVRLDVVGGADWSAGIATIGCQSSAKYYGGFESVNNHSVYRGYFVQTRNHSWHGTYTVK